MASGKMRFPNIKDINPGGRERTTETSNPNRPKSIPDKGPTFPSGSGNSEPSKPSKK